MSVRAAPVDRAEAAPEGEGGSDGLRRVRPGGVLEQRRGAAGARREAPFGERGLVRGRGAAAAAGAAARAAAAGGAELGAAGGVGEGRERGERERARRRPRARLRGEAPREAGGRGGPAAAAAGAPAAAAVGGERWGVGVRAAAEAAGFGPRDWGEGLRGEADPRGGLAAAADALKDVVCALERVILGGDGVQERSAIEPEESVHSPGDKRHGARAETPPYMAQC